MYTCYKITNTVNGKLYIGQTNQTVDRRWKQHVYASRRVSSREYTYALHEDIRRYGVDAFVTEVIDTTDSCKHIDVLERQYISEYATHVSCGGYNMTFGGGGTIGYVFTEDDRSKMAAAQRGRKRGPHTEETKKLISDAHKKAGHGPSLLCNARRRETGTGVSRPESVKERIRQTLTGRKRPPEVIEKIKAGHARRKAPHSND